MGFGLKILTADLVRALATIEVVFVFGIELRRSVWYSEWGFLRTPMIVHCTGGVVADGVCCNRRMICAAGFSAWAILSKSMLSSCRASLLVRIIAQSLSSIYLAAATRLNADLGTTWHCGSLPEM